MSGSIPTKAIAINLALMLDEWVGDSSGDWRSGAASVIEHRLNRLMERGQPDSNRDAGLTDAQIDACMASTLPGTRPSKGFRAFARAAIDAAMAAQAKETPP